MKVLAFITKINLYSTKQIVKIVRHYLEIHAASPLFAEISCCSVFLIIFLIFPLFALTGQWWQGQHVFRNSKYPHERGGKPLR